MHIRTLLLAAAALTASAQTLQTYREEISVNPADVALSAVPPEMADAIAAGQLDIRQQIQYDAAASELVVRTFAMPAGSPPLTPMIVLQNVQWERFRVAVDQVLVEPGRLTFAGVVKPGTRAPVNRAYDEARYTLTTQYSGGDPADFTNTIATIGGETTIYAFQGAGTVGFSELPNRAPVIVMPELIEAVNPEVRIDATATYDPDGDELDFKWFVIAGAASLRGCETNFPVLQLSQGAGTYEAEVYVTDTKGVSSRAVVKIVYTGR